MRHIVKKTSGKSGLPPGTLVHIGDKVTEEPKVTLIHYTEEHFEEKAMSHLDECLAFKDKPGVTWINVDGLSQVDIIARLGAQFNLHPLLLEDIVNTEQRPKMEDFDDSIFTVMKMLSYDSQKAEIRWEQVSLIFGKNFVLSFQEPDGDVFGPVRERLRKNKGRIRKAGPDFLAYSLMDAIVDNYFDIIEKIGEQIEFVENDIIAHPGPKTLPALHALKREMVFLRKAVWPLRDVVASLGRGDSKLIGPETKFFLRDLHDHTLRVIETVETYRDLLSGILEIYLSNVSNTLNQIMKVLTIITTIFIPLSFIAGVYGMNFKYMPELEWRWGYPLTLAAMLAIGIAMIFYFRRKKWL